jgi:DNA invertase Pin-like site-specific DNA recombinase
MKIAAYAYCRVSGLSQAGEDRDGIERQSIAIRTWAAANNHHIVKWFKDAITGKTDLEDRPALYSLMAALHANGTRVVIIENVGRLARELMIQESVIADFQRNGFEIISTTEPDLCSKEPTRILLRQMMGAFMQYERTMIVQKLWGARQRAAAKDKNYTEGRKPFGHRPGEQLVIDRIVAMRAEKMSLPQIANALNGDGTMARAGRWHPTSVRNVLTRCR